MSGVTDRPSGISNKQSATFLAWFVRPCRTFQAPRPAQFGGTSEEVNLMRKREIATLLVTFALCWSTGRGRPSGREFRSALSASSSVIRVQLAQEGRASGGYSTDGPVGGSAGGPVTMGGQAGNGVAVCEGKSAGDSCSFTAPDGQTVNGTCTTIPNQLLCVPAGGMINYGTGESGSQSDGDR